MTYQCLSSYTPNLLYIPPLAHLHHSLMYTANIELIQKANTLEGFLTANCYRERTLLTLRAPVTHLTSSTSSKKGPKSLQTATVAGILLSDYCALSIGSITFNTIGMRWYKLTQLAVTDHLLKRLQLTVSVLPNISLASIFDTNDISVCTTTAY
jgi:hypothetical protein